MGALCSLDTSKFWDKILFTTDCWIWTASKDSSGYGKIMFNKKIVSAHRMAYNLFFGEIPNKLEIDHLCRNRPCVNPNHMEVVTHKENCKRGDHVTNNYNRQKIFCPKGHELCLDNLVISDKHRKCKICHNESVRISCRIRYRLRKGLT